MIEVYIESLKWRINELDHQLVLGIISKRSYYKLLLECEHELRLLEESVYNA